MSIDLTENEKEVSDYIESLMKSASESALRDAFSNTTIFDETNFTVSTDDTLKALIRSTQQLIVNVEYGKIIEKYIDRSDLRKLACELIEERWRQEDEIRKNSVEELMDKDSIIDEGHKNDY